MRTRLAFTAALCAFAATASAQTTRPTYPPVNIPETEVRTLHSNATGHNYDLYIYRPNRIALNSTSKVPVLYLLDAQWDFKLLASIQGGLYYDRYVPDVIIVGITYSGPTANYDSLRAVDYTPIASPSNAHSGGAPKFLEFMKRELMPFIESQYPVDPKQRGLMGNSLGGLFALYAMFSEPRLFSGYVAGSPAVTYAQRGAFAQEAAHARSSKSLPARLFVAVGSDEALSAPVHEFVTTLRGRGYPDLVLEARTIEEERHSGNKPEGLNRGMRFLFGDASSAKASAPGAPLTLKDAFKDAFRVGAALNEDIVSGRDSASQRIVLQQFNTITAENVLKAGPLNPERGVYNWGPADAFVEFGEKHGMFIVGHTLVWHNQVPAWFFQDATGKANTPAQQLERLRSHIEAVAGRYKGRIKAWDVVNEVIDNDGSYRQTAWVNAVGNGDSLVTNAFRFAAQYAPNTELYYNDFNTWRPAKRDGIVRLVRMLQKQGIRIDGVGMQGHWGLNYPKKEYIEAAIDSFAALGLKVMITELDVDVLPLTREGQIVGQVLNDRQFQLEEFKQYLDPYQQELPPEVQKQLADRYAELFEIFYRKRDKIDRVTFWGVHDGMSWKNGYPIPGRTNYPLLWGRDRKPKPAFEAVLRVPAITN